MLTHVVHGCFYIRPRSRRIQDPFRVRWFTPNKYPAIDERGGAREEALSVYSAGDRCWITEVISRPIAYSAWRFASWTLSPTGNILLLPAVKRVSFELHGIGDFSGFKQLWRPAASQRIWLHPRSDHQRCSTARWRRTNPFSVNWVARWSARKKLKKVTSFSDQNKNQNMTTNC